MTHNLPARLTSFVGREREIAEIDALVRRERLVTLVGAPGVGKTRLSLQIGASVLDAFDDGVWLVELAPLADPTLAPQAVADVLGVRDQPERLLAATLAEHLQARQVLLLLDNCEHLIATVAVLAETLLHACPRLHILATSREPLAIEGEITRRVPSLSVPDGTPGTVADSEAVRLFVARAQAADAAFSLTKQNTPIVAQICARLDGIPLAIELAAARTRAHSVEQIAARLDDRFRLLTGGSRTALPRQQTLRGAIDWSYDLISEAEQTVMRRLAVFVGGFDADAGSWVMGPGDSLDPSPHTYPLRGGNIGYDVVRRTMFAGPRPDIPTPDTLVSLIDKSLVQVVEERPDERRYRLLETIREYCLEKLAQHDELERARSWHRDYFLAVAERLAPHVFAPGQIGAMAQIDREHDNLRAALAWCLEEASVGSDAPDPDLPDRPSPRPDAAVRIAAVVWHFWWRRGHFDEGRRWLDRILELPWSDSSRSQVSARAQILWGAADLAANQGDYPTSVRHMEEALALWQRVGDEGGVVRARFRLGFYLVHLGEYERADRLCQQSIALGRPLGDPFLLVHALIAAGIVAENQGQFERSASFCEESVALCRQIGHDIGAAYSLRALGRAVLGRGEAELAATLADEALRSFQRLGDRRGIALAHWDVGACALLEGDADRAIRTLQESIRILREVGDRWVITRCFYDLARARTLQSTRGQAEPAGGQSRPDEPDERLLDAARLVAAADALRGNRGIVLHPSFRIAYARDLTLLRQHADDSAFRQASAEGCAMSLEQGIEYALAIVTPEEPVIAPQPSDGDLARLTRREREVSVLAARGLTNRQIAEELILSERTVDSHVHNILGKLELTSRTQIAVWAIEHGLADSRYFR